jgi:type VI secretion system protein ImpB
MKPLKDRRFVAIDRDNFNEVMSKFAPGLGFRVKNTLKDDGSEMAVALKFNSMADFEPAKIVDQVDPLKKLMESRDKLRDLLTKVDRSDELENLLEKVLKETEGMQRLKAELGEGGDAKAPEGEG